MKRSQAGQGTTGGLRLQEPLYEESMVADRISRFCGDEEENPRQLLMNRDVKQSRERENSVGIKLVW